MGVNAKPERELEERMASRAMDVFVRIGLVLALALLGCRALLPFLTLMIGSLILAVALSAVWMSSLGDSVHRFIRDVQSNSLELPAPAASVAQAPSLHSLTRF